MTKPGSDSKRRVLTIRPGPNLDRLDRTVAALLAGKHSRSEIARLIREGRVLVNGRKAKPSTPVHEGDRVEIEFPPPEPSHIPPEDLELSIVFEDEHLLVVDKPAGMVTHPAGSRTTGTLVNALLHRVRDLSGIGGVARPGIVHRLDKGTSGLLVVAKNDRTHRDLAGQLASRTLQRTYEALVWGRVTPGSFTIEGPIARDPRDRKRMAIVPGGKEAVSRVRVVRARDLASHLEVSLETGRTHQIRVHLKHRGHPLVGDAQYGGRRRFSRGFSAAARADADRLLAAIDRPALHARRLELIHPISGEKLSFDSALPEDFRRALEVCFPS
jgi:23S rRNA pseudouridine1911/1915/1917 synthase